MSSERPLSTAISELTPAGDFERECVSFFAEVVQLFGVPKSVGQIYGLLYASPEPLGFPDIVERLEISKGSASQGLQLLRSLGAIIEVNSAHEVEIRGVIYEPELGLRRLMKGVLRGRVASMAATSAERVNRLGMLAERSPSQSKFYLDRAKKIQTWQRRFKAVMPLLVALLGPEKKSK